MAPSLVPDQLDAAIAAVGAGPQLAQVRMTEVRVDLGPGRFVMLALPVDLNLAEVLALVGWLTSGGLAQTLAAAQKPQLEIARVMPT